MGIPTAPRKREKFGSESFRIVDRILKRKGASVRVRVFDLFNPPFVTRFNGLRRLRTTQEGQKV